MCVCVRAAVCDCSEFTAQSGATNVVPCSHLSGRHPTAEEAAAGGAAVGSIALQAPAGTCVVVRPRELWIRLDGLPVINAYHVMYSAGAAAPEVSAGCRAWSPDEWFRVMADGRTAVARRRREQHSRGAAGIVLLL